MGSINKAFSRMKNLEIFCFFLLPRFACLIQQRPQFSSGKGEQHFPNAIEVQIVGHGSEGVIVDGNLNLNGVRPPSQRTPTIGSVPQPVRGIIIPRDQDNADYWFDDYEEAVTSKGNMVGY
jgi:hypothetical protein